MPKKKAEKKEQGAHDAPKKEVKPVLQEETKQLLEEDKVDEALKQQAQREQAIKAAEKAEESKSRVVDSTKQNRPTKEQYEALLERYKKENPIKYKIKEPVLLARLKSL